MAFWTIGLYFSHLLSLIYESHAYPRRSRSADNPYLRNAARHPYRHLRYPHPFARQFDDDASLSHLQSRFSRKPDAPYTRRVQTRRGIRHAFRQTHRSDDVRCSSRNSRVVLGIPPRRIQYRCRQRSRHRRI